MNEFRKALDNQEHAANEAIKAGFPFWDDDDNKTVRKALLIADKLMQEPSDDMVLAALIKRQDDLDPTNEELSICFKAMRDQIIKEIESN